MHNEPDTWSIVVTVCNTCFNIKKFFIFPTQYIYVFHMILMLNSYYAPHNVDTVFPIRKQLHV
jgi:hypothetical protein